MLAVDQWRPYLQFQEFIIKTYQKSLINLADQRLHTPWQQKALTKLMGVNYKIVYKKGSGNTAADALSRRPHAESQVLALSCAQPSWLEEIVQSYTADAKAQELLQQLSVQPDSKPNFQLLNGIVRYKGCIWVGNKSELHTKIYQAFHATLLGGHSGFPVTNKRIHALFKWVGMKKFVQQYVQSCLICQKAKPERVSYPGLLSPLPVPTKAWETVTMDFISGLPSSDQFDCIMVVIDKFTKYGHFIAVKHPYNAQKIADIFLDNVYKLHSMPKYIVSN